MRWQHLAMEEQRDTTHRAHELHMSTQVLLNFALMMDAMHTKASVIMPRATTESCTLSTLHSTALGADVVCAGQPGRLVAAVSGKTPSDKTTMQTN